MDKAKWFGESVDFNHPLLSLVEFCYEIYFIASWSKRVVQKSSATLVSKIFKSLALAATQSLCDFTLKRRKLFIRKISQRKLVEKRC